MRPGSIITIHVPSGRQEWLVIKSLPAQHVIVPILPQTSPAHAGDVPVSERSVARCSKARLTTALYDSIAVIDHATLAKCVAAAQHVAQTISVYRRSAPMSGHVL